MSIVKPFGDPRLAARNLDRFQHQNDTLCTWRECGNDADENFNAPVCMTHAKQLAVQVMLLTAKKPVTIGRSKRRQNAGVLTQRTAGLVLKMASCTSSSLTGESRLASQPTFRSACGLYRTMKYLP